MTSVLPGPPALAPPPPPRFPGALRSGAAGSPPSRSDRLTGLWRGSSSDPRWARPALLGLLAATALLYLWDLGGSGTANDFYAAAVQAGGKSWKAWFFGSFDSSNFITVDKPPASLWVMGLSARIFGFSSWSMLVPNALEGVAAVGLLYGTVRRVSGSVAGLFAGAALALTPAAALIFRFNNPDALLVLLMVGAAYATMRAVESGRTRWLLLAGSLIGFGFLTKMLQAMLVVPGLGLAYLVAGPPRLRTRFLQLLGAGGALVASAGWWVLAVALTPAADRPYIGGSGNNSVLGLAFGYNGLGRIFGNSDGGGGGAGAGGGPPAGAGAGPGGGGGFGGATGLTRLFRDEMGLEVSWLLPAALLGLLAGLWLTRRAPRTDRTRASLLLWGGWLLVTGLVFSYMKGIIHPYYTVALAPGIAALVAIPGRLLWQSRRTWESRIAMSLILAVTAAWDFSLLSRTPDWYPALRWLLVPAAAAAIGGLLLGGARLRAMTVTVAVAGALTGAVGTGAYAVATASVPHATGLPTVGPASSTSALAFGGPPGAGAPTATGTPTGAGETTPSAAAGAADGGSTADSGSTANSALVALLKATTNRWSAATIGSMTASPLETSSDTAVMAIGGFTGGDAAPTLAQFQAYVAAGDIHYFIAGGDMGGGPGGMGAGGPAGGSSTGGQITSWVQSHFTATTVGGTTVYDLTSPAGGTGT